jgi:hypothetical protein
MLRKIVPFRSWHYEWLGDGSEPGVVKVHPSVLAELEGQNGGSGTVDGELVFCAGTIRQWPQRHVAWALLHPTLSKRHMLWITREVQKNLARVQGRIEMTVRADFPSGQRWAEMLGFEVETPLLKQYGPEGEDHVGYTRIN